MYVGEIFRQLERRGANAAADEAVQHLGPLVLGGLAEFLLEISEVDDALAAAYDEELVGVVLHRAVAARLLQVGHNQPRELVTGGGPNQKVKPSHGASPV